MFRPNTLLPPALGMLTGALVALGAAPRWKSYHEGSYAAVALNIIIGCFMAVVLNAASNTINQVSDVKNDKINKPDRVIPSKRISISEAATVGIITWVAALALAFVVSFECLVIVFIASVCIYAYSMPPLRLKAHTWFSNLTVALPRGLLLPVAGWSSVKSVMSPEPWYIGSVFFLFIMGATTTKDFSDIQGDREAGCQTLPVKYGMKKSARLIAPFFVFPFFLLPAGAFSGLLTGDLILLTILSTLLVVLGVYSVTLLLRDPEMLSEGGNHPGWKYMYFMMMVFQLGLALSYLIKA